MLSEKALRDFKKIYREEFGKNIPDELAIEEAINLLVIIDKTYRPIKQKRT